MLSNIGRFLLDFSPSLEKLASGDHFEALTSKIGTYLKYRLIKLFDHERVGILIPGFKFN